MNDYRIMKNRDDAYAVIHVGGMAHGYDALLAIKNTLDDAVETMKSRHQSTFPTDTFDIKEIIFSVKHHNG